MDKEAQQKILDAYIDGIKDEKIKEFQEHIEVNGFNRFPTLFLPKTALMRKLVDENTKKDDLKNKFEQNIKYKNVDKFVDELVGLITVPLQLNEMNTIKKEKNDKTNND